MNTQKSDYYQHDHAHCWEGDNPPCGQQIKHFKCCLCEIEHPDITTIRQEAKERERTLLTKHEDAVLERERRRVIHSWNKAEQQLDGTAQGAVNAIEQFRETLKALSQNKV